MKPEDAERALPTFSTAERDRRWGRVRELMAARGIDVLVAPPNTGSYDKHQADARYLTQFGINAESAACVFPLQGRVVGLAGPSARLAPGWIEDVRTPHRTFVDAIVDALKELNVGAGTIGVCGLAGGTLSYVRAPDGVVGSTLMDRIRAEFPKARIVDATDVTGEARMVKGEEEIAFLEQATQVSEAALQGLLVTALPGVSETACCAALYKAAIERGGSLPFMLGWVSGPAGKVYPRITQPTQRVLRDGDVILKEIEGRWAGYAAQIDQSTFVGRVPDFCQDAWKVGVEAFERAVAAMKPGVTYGELLQACAATPKTAGWSARLVLHGRGLGDDGPLITNPPHDPVIMERPLAPGNVFVIKPAAYHEGYTETARFGDSVAVTATGARRLGTRGQDFATYNVGV
jgi:Xaa-Pro aminopeptidase